jgi:hypothetical protein
MKFALVAFFTTTSVLSLLLAYYGVVGRKGDRGQKASASLALLLGVFAALWSALGIAGALRKTDVSHIELLQHYIACVAFGIVLSMAVSSKIVFRWGWTCIASTDSKGQHRGEDRRSAN